MTKKIMAASLLIMLLFAPASAPAETGDYERGVAYLRAGKAAEALGLLEPLASSRKDDPYLAYHTGLAYFKLGRLGDALDSFTAARSLAKDAETGSLGLGVAFSNLGVAYHRDGANDKARTCLEDALAIDPDDGDSRYYLGLVLIGLGEYDRAVAELAAAGELLKTDTASSAAVSNALGMARYKAGDNQDAMKEFAHTLDMAPENVEALYYLGQLNYKENGFAAAKPFFDRLTHAAVDQKTKDTLFTTFFNMGVDFQDRGMSGSAAEMFEKASTLNPDDAETHYYRGYNLMALERYEDALSEFNKALSLDPGMKRATAQMEVASKFAAEQSIAAGAERMNREDYFSAIPFFEKAVSLDPKNEAAAAGLANAAAQARKDADTRMAKARALMGAGDYSSALSEVDALIKLDPGSGKVKSLKKQIAAKVAEESEALLSTAAVSEKKDQLADALASYRRALSIMPDSSRARDGVARIEAAIAKLRKKARDAKDGGLLVQARESYQRLRSYVPDDWEASSALAEVEQDIKAELAKRITNARNSFGAEDYSMAAYHAGRALELDQANQEALSLKQRIKDRSKELVNKYVREGNASLENGDRDKATGSFEAALLLDPDNSGARKGIEKARYAPPSAANEDEVRRLYLEGVEHYTKGELDSAVASWRKVLKMDPSNEKAASSIKRAEEKMKQTGDVSAQ